jgi:HEAT repeat protein
VDDFVSEDISAKRRRARRLALLLAAAAAAASILTAAGFWTWHLRAIRDPLHLIKHGDPFERLQAAADLGALKEDMDVDRVVAALVDAMDDGEIVLRSAAADSLGSLTAQILSRPGGGTPDERERTARRLAFAIRSLNEGFSDPEPTIRASAASALGQLASENKVDLPSELVVALHDQSPHVRQAAAKALKNAQLTSSVVPALITALASPEPELRFQATEILARVGPAAAPAVPALLPMLSEPFDRKKSKTERTPPNFWDPACGAAIALGRIGVRPETIAGLTGMLSSDVPARMHSAASALAKLGPAAGGAVPAIIAEYDKVLKAEGHVLGQSALAMALGELGPRSPAAADAAAILTRALDCHDLWVGVSAADALGKFGRGASAAVPELRNLAQSPIPDLQNAAKKAVAAIEAELATTAVSSSVAPGP